MGIFAQLWKAIARGDQKEVTIPTNRPEAERMGHGGAGLEASIEVRHIDRESFKLDIVGESYYQKNLWRLNGPGRRSNDGVHLFETAEVIPEKNNPYDENAVRIDIDGLQVGHLSRANALLYRKKFGTKRTECMAWVRGGYKQEDGERAFLGVKLDLEL